MRGDRHGKRRVSERDLAAFADGSLTGPRRALVEHAVADSPALQARVGEQRRALAAVRSARGEPAPAAIRVPPATARRRQRRPRPRAVAPATASVLTAVTLALGFLGGSGAGAGLTVADAAVLAARPPTAPVHEAAAGETTLPGPRAAGLPFPYWQDRFGWRAAGFRRDTLDGRLLTTVFYERRGQLIAYTIVSGGMLTTHVRARVSVGEGTLLRSLSVDHRQVVTWLRRGHTCVLSGTRTPVTTLLRLAAWRGNGALPY